jgi:hypothetical protein
MALGQLPVSGRLGVFTVCTSSTHPSSPSVGDSLFETDTGKFLQYQSATTGWTPPWNSDFGNMGSGSTPTTQSGITTIADLTSLTVTFTAIANRRYKVTGNLHLSNTTATDGCVLTLADGSNAVKNTWVVDSATANQVVPVTPYFIVTGLAAGSQTLKSASRTARAARPPARRLPPSSPASAWTTTAPTAPRCSHADHV